MLLMNIRVLSLAAVVGGSILFVGCKPSESSATASADPPFATINGKTITQGRFLRFLQNKPGVRVTLEGQVAEFPVTETLGFQALEDLVAQELTLELAKEDGVLPTDEEVKAEIALRTRLTPTFESSLRERGLTDEDIMESIRADLARERLLTKGVTVTIPEVDDFIAKNKEAFTMPATVQSYWIWVPEQKDQKAIDDALATGKPFAEVAVEMSKAPDAKQTGARFPVTVINELPESLKKELSAVALRTPTGWIKAEPGFAKFYVEERAEAKPVDLNEDRKLMIQRQLAMQKSASTSDLRKRLLEKFKTVNVNLDGTGLDRIWTQAMADMRSAEAAAASALEPTTPPAGTPPPSGGQ